jgi:viologen exporter family transport system permease protein
MGGYGVSADLATGERPPLTKPGALFALAAAGFRRFSTYRQAAFASTFTNCVFGFLRCYVLLAAAAATGRAGGYDRAQLVLYCWASQGLIGVVLLWGWTELGDRIRTGDVVGDLLRPVHPVVSYLAVDLGRAAFAVLIRFVVPITVGAIFFTMYIPRRVITYPLFVVSVVLAVVVSFGVRYLINAAGFWLLDVRGVVVAETVFVSLFAGLTFPLHFLPGWLTWLIWVATPYPSIMQAPLDVLVERGPVVDLLGVVAGQVAWAVVVLLVCRLVQSRAERRLVVQGG